MKEISRREKEVGIIPEPDIDTFMKVNNVHAPWFIFPLMGLPVDNFSTNRQYQLKD